MEFNITNSDQFLSTLQRVGRQFPGETEKSLRLVSNKFRREVKADTPIGTRRTMGKHLKNSYTMPAIRRNGNTLEREFYSRAKHFHLVERGHEVVYGGQIVGSRRKSVVRTGRRVQGVKMVENKSQEFNFRMAEEMEETLKRVLRRANL